MSLGLPPRKFDFAYRDKDDNYQSEKGITPQEFLQEICQSSSRRLRFVISTADKPYGKSYTVEMLGNVVGSRAVRYINVPMERLKELAIAQMQTGETVWFGSDVGQFSNRKAGILATDVYDLNQAWIFNSLKTRLDV